MESYFLVFAIWLEVGRCKCHWHYKICMNIYFTRLYMNNIQQPSTVSVKYTYMKFIWNKRLIVSSYNNLYACIMYIKIQYTTMFKKYEMRNAKSLNEWHLSYLDLWTVNRERFSHIHLNVQRSYITIYNIQWYSNRIDSKLTIVRTYICKAALDFRYTISYRMRIYYNIKLTYENQQGIRCLGNEHSLKEYCMRNGNTISQKMKIPMFKKMSTMRMALPVCDVY